MRAIQEFSETMNSYVYRRQLKQVLANTTGLCTYCGYHCGHDNFDGYSGPNASWKITSKKPKQWQYDRNQKRKPEGYNYWSWFRK